MSTIVILGAGELGGSLAHRVARADIVRRVTIVDDAAAVARGKALDIQQAAPIEGFSTRLSGTADLGAVIGACAVVLADREGAPDDEWRDDNGLALVARVNALNNSAMLLCAGGRQTTVVERGVSELGLLRSRLFGSAPEALRSAIAGLVALEARCAPGDVSLCLQGRPPDDVVVPWDSASLGGRGVAAVLSPHILLRLQARVRQLWPPGPSTLSSAATRTLRAAFERSPRGVACLVALERGEGLTGRGAIAQVQLNSGGIVRLLPSDLTPREQVRLDVALGR